MPLSGSLSCSLFVTQKPEQKKPHKPSQTWLPCPNKVLPAVKHIWQAAEFCVWGLL